MSTKINIMAITIVGIIVGAVGILVWYNTYVQSEYDKKDQRISQLEADAQELLKTKEITDSIPTNNDSTTTVGSVESNLPIFTFEPSGAFSPEEKTEIEKKLIEPYFLYFNEDSLQAVTMNVSTGYDDAWGVFVTNINGSYSSFLYGQTAQTEQDWWSPDCFEGCNFSNTFRGAYPEIVSNNSGL